MAPCRVVDREQRARVFFGSTSPQTSSRTTMDAVKDLTESGKTFIKDGNNVSSFSLSDRVSSRFDVSLLSPSPAPLIPRANAVHDEVYKA